MLLACGELQGERTILESLSLQEFCQSGQVESRNPQAAVRNAALKLGIKGPTTVLVSRELVEMRTLQIPKMGAEELPDIIRFQAQRQFTSMTDGWVVDFVMLPQATGQEMQTALVAAMSPAQLAEIETACSASGLQAERVLLRPLEVARLAVKKSSVASAACSLVVCVSVSSAEILLLRRGQVVLVRTTRLPEEPEQKIALLQNEIRRSLLAGSSELGSEKIETVTLISSNAIGQSLVEPIRSVVKASVELLSLEQLISLGAGDPSAQELLQTAGSRLAAMAGSMQSASGVAAAVDFKHPKKRQPKKKNTRTLILSAVAGSAILLLGLGWYFSRLSQLNAEFEQYSSEIASRENVGKAAEGRIAELQALEKFLDASPNWLDEVAIIAKNMPPSGKIKLENPSFSISSQGEGVISLTVKADEASSISEFEQSLRSTNHIVSGTGASQLPSPEENYRWKAQSTIQIAGRGWRVSTPRTTASEVETREPSLKQTPAKESEENLKGEADDAT